MFRSTLRTHTTIILVALVEILDASYRSTRNGPQAPETFKISSELTTSKSPDPGNFTIVEQNTETFTVNKRSTEGGRNNSIFGITTEITTVTDGYGATNATGSTTNKNRNVTVTVVVNDTSEASSNVNDTMNADVEDKLIQENGAQNGSNTSLFPTVETATNVTVQNNASTEYGDLSIDDFFSGSDYAVESTEPEEDEDVSLSNCLIDNDGIDFNTFEIIESVFECCKLKVKNYDLHSLSPKGITKAYVVIEFWISMFLVFFGLVGNILCFIVLYREKTSTSMFFLKSLSSCDAVYCLWYLMFIPYSVAYEYTGWITNRDLDIVNWIPYNLVRLTPINFVLQTISIWIVVLLTIDRYIAICFPFKAKLLCTLNKVRIQVGILVLLSIAFAIPQGLQSYSKMSNNVCFGTPMVVTQLTEFGKSFGCTVVYNVILDGLLRYIIPSLIVLSMNFLLIKDLRQAAAKRMQLSSSVESNQQDRNISVMLVTVATTFLILILPQICVKILKSLTILNLENIIHVTVDESHTSIIAVVLASNLALRINSSINFILYITVSQRFRKGFFQLFRCARVLTSKRIPSGTRSNNGSTTGTYSSSDL